MLFPTEYGRRKFQQEFCVLQLQIFFQIKSRSKIPCKPSFLVRNSTCLTL